MEKKTGWGNVRLPSTARWRRTIVTWTTLPRGSNSGKQKTSADDTRREKRTTSSATGTKSWHCNLEDRPKLQTKESNSKAVAWQQTTGADDTRNPIRRVDERRASPTAGKEEHRQQQAKKSMANSRHQKSTASRPATSSRSSVVQQTQVHPKCKERHVEMAKPVSHPGGLLCTRTRFGTEAQQGAEGENQGHWTANRTRKRVCREKERLNSWRSVTASSSSSSNQLWETAFVQNGQEHDNDEDDLGVPKNEVYILPQPAISNSLETQPAWRLVGYNCLKFPRREPSQSWQFRHRWRWRDRRGQWRQSGSSSCSVHVISRRTEAHAAHNFAWLQQSLED